MFPTQGGMYKSEKIQQAFWREIKPKRVLEIWKDVSLRLILKDKGVLSWVFYPEGWDIFEKEGTS